jgi:hypothetical protein
MDIQKGEFAKNGTIIPIITYFLSQIIFSYFVIIFNIQICYFTDTYIDKAIEISIHTDTDIQSKRLNSGPHTW